MVEQVKKRKAESQLDKKQEQEEPTACDHIMGELDDEDSDDMDDEIIIHNSDDEQPTDQMLLSDEQEPETKLYLPSQPLEPDHTLTVDNSAYELLHSMGVEWPCLSFDILTDGLGANRSTYPATTYLVTGSQAPVATDNKIYIMKMSQLNKTKFDDGDEDEMNEDDDVLDDDPILESKTVSHPTGGINRIRVMPHPESHIVSTWCESSFVHIYDLTNHVLSLDTPGLIPSPPKPLYSVPHSTQGFAMDWSSSSRLLTGDCNGEIKISSKASAGFTSLLMDKGHEGSVEDLQWSPTESDVFASAGTDGFVRIWDSRQKKCVLGVKANEVDINVISWNRTADYLLASGADDGSFSIWDLRTFSSESVLPAASFTWHKAPITSIEWHPSEGSVLAVSGEDDQISIWDIALEADVEEGGDDDFEGPPQLLFIHQGQTHIKEVHFHKQIPGLMVSTAYDGFNVFKTINV